MRKTPKRGVNWVFKNLFEHNKFKHNKNEYKEIKLEKSNSDFIVVRHFLAYVHFPQAPNRLRVPLTWSFNQASNLLTLGFRLQWALTQPLQDSTLLKTLTLRLLQNILTQPSLKMAQIQGKARMTTRVH